jgi:hypothetical protein
VSIARASSWEREREISYLSRWHARCGLFREIHKAAEWLPDFDEAISVRITQPDNRGCIVARRIEADAPATAGTACTSAIEP